MELTKVDLSRGAPLGRRDTHYSGAERPHFELEWVPFTDGGYDSQGAYWGTPDNLYCAEASIHDDVAFIQVFLRADSREAAKAEILKQYLDATFAPENGSLVGQMIEHLQSFLDRCHERGDHEFDEGTEREISDLQDWLDDLATRNAESGENP